MAPKKAAARATNTKKASGGAKRLAAGTVEFHQESKRRILKKTSIEDEVQHMINVNFLTKGMTDMEVDVKRQTNGKTLRELLTEHYQEKRDKGTGPFVACAAYFGRLRDDYRGSADPLTLIRPSNTNLEISPDMLAAMIAAQKRDRSGFMALFTRNFQANEAEVCGVWRVAYKLNPGNPDMLPFCVQAMQWTARNDYHTTYSVPQFDAMKPWVNSMLLALWKTAKSGNTPIKAFISNHHQLISLVTDVARLKVVLNADDKSKCAQELLEVVTGSDLGYAVLGGEVKNIAGTLIDNAITEGLKKFGTETDLTNDAYYQVMTEVMKSVSEMSYFKHWPSVYIGQLTYRGMTCETAFNTPEEIASLRLMAFVKEQAVTMNQLPELFCEGILDLNKTPPFGTKKVHEELLNGAIVARQRLKEAIEDERVQAADTANQLLWKMLPNLKLMDPSFAVHITFIVCECSNNISV